MKPILPWAAALLCALPLAAAPPTPQSHFGHPIGQDRTLLDWDKVVSYFQALAKTSDRIRVKEIGKTAEGRPMIYATISSAANLRNLDQYLEIQRRLADPRVTSEAEAARLAKQGKIVVLITCSIHATEVASTHTAVEFAYRLLTEDQPKFQAILDNVIVLLVPSLNPDGVDIVTRWYRKTLGTPFEGTNPPELYHKYVGHDNNRDWYIFSQPETRSVISQIHNVWHPQIVYDVHQQGSFASRMFVPPWMDPVDPNVDPIISQLGNMIGAGMAADLTAAGKTGVVINALYDFWTPSRHYQAYHGGLRILSESASAKIATPMQVKPSEINETGLGYQPRERSWNYLEPWLGGQWRLRDIIDYQSIAWESCLFQAATRREDMLRDFYRVGQRSIARPSPYAFVISSNQRDPGATKKMLETLDHGMVEIERAPAPFEAAGRLYSKGSFVIRMQQPYSGYAKTLLERQNYPDMRLYPGGPPKRPYDVTAQTLPLLMGVDVDTIDAPFRAAEDRVHDFSIPSRDSAVRFPAEDTASWKKVNQIWKSGGTVYRNPQTGEFSRQAAADVRPVVRPRIGLYQSWIPVMDEGWTRWLLEDFGFAYSTLRNKDIIAGQLRDRFDVIVFPDQNAASIRSGFEANAMPEEYTGGLGAKGAESLKQFAANGGTLIFLNASTEYAIGQLGLLITNSLAGISNREFYSPGSLLNVRLEPGPLTYGLPKDIAIWSEQSPAFQIPASGTAATTVVARYPSAKLLASGWLLGEKYLTDKAALVDVPLGRGRIILFGMRPQYRAQSYQSFKLFFNALLYF